MYAYIFHTAESTWKILQTQHNKKDSYLENFKKAHVHQQNKTLETPDLSWKKMTADLKTEERKLDTYTTCVVNRLSGNGGKSSIRGGKKLLNLSTGSGIGSDTSQGFSFELICQIMMQERPADQRLLPFSASSQ